MKELTDQLLDASDEQMSELLDSYKEDLLEPLEDDDAVLDADSIYTPGMSRSERYATYRASMEERISKARNDRVRRVLQAMCDYVVSFE